MHRIPAVAHSIIHYQEHELTSHGVPFSHSYNNIELTTFQHLHLPYSMDIQMTPHNLPVLT